MHELRAMWRNTRMIVLCAISAALYAAILVPFKVVPLIPGVTELRPANAIPVVCSFLFGPAAAWGSAIGNMIGDFFGGVSPGDTFGFIGNLAYGYLPYKVWTIVVGDGSPLLDLESVRPSESHATVGSSLGPLAYFIASAFVGGLSARFLGMKNRLVIVLFAAFGAGTYLVLRKFVASGYFLVCLLASVLCADLIGFGDNVLAIRPFFLLGNVVILNNMIAALVLSPFILRAVYPRVERGRVLYKDVMPELEPAPRSQSLAGLAMLLIGSAGAWLTGNAISLGYLSGRLPPWMDTAQHDRAIALITGPFLLLAIAGMALL